MGQKHHSVQATDQNRTISDLMTDKFSQLFIPPFCFGLWGRKRYLENFLGAPLSVATPFARHQGNAVYVGWGCKRSGRKAEALAKKENSSYLLLEDGFLRSFFPGKHFSSLSLVLDKRGIYYDTTRPSQLEDLLNSETDLLAGLEAEAAHARWLIVTHRLSKYNHAPDLRAGVLREGDRQRVLVVDQTKGDLGVALGGADASTFATMLVAALEENPRATIYVKTHPEVSAGSKGGYLTNIKNDSRVVLLREAINPMSLIEQMNHVYVVSSTMGFEALLANKPVTCLGLPWYAGWGVTDDRQMCPRRSRQRSVDELFAAAYFHYSRYLDPITHQRGTIFDVIDWLILQRKCQLALRHGFQMRFDFDVMVAR